MEESYSNSSILQPFDYHIRVVEHFSAQKKTWDFFASAASKAEQWEKFRLELLKNSYQFNPSDEVELYKSISTVKSRLGMDNLVVNVYQVNNSLESNASIAYNNNEAHIVFSGRLLQQLDNDELMAVLAHELSHIKFYSLLRGDMEVADQIIMTIANGFDPEPSYFETARKFNLYKELFCDRGSLAVVGDIKPVISSLLKIVTSLDKVNVDSYLKQATQILDVQENAGSAGSSHPENYLRIWALHVFTTDKDNAEAKIKRNVEGSFNIDKLDIFGQTELQKITREFIQLILKPNWTRTTPMLSHAKMFFNDFGYNEAILITDVLLKKYEELSESVKNYLCFILLDFAFTDPSMEDVPLGWAFQLSEDIGLKKEFENIVQKEFKYSDKKLTQKRETALNAWYQVKEGSNEQLYVD